MLSFAGLVLLVLLDACVHFTSTFGLTLFGFCSLHYWGIFGIENSVGGFLFGRENMHWPCCESMPDLALAVSDLKGCNDRIIHNAAALALLRIGGTRSQNSFDVWDNSKDGTWFGDSTETYGGDDIMDWQFTPQGVLQGNASGPTICSVLSSVIFMKKDLE